MRDVTGVFMEPAILAATDRLSRHYNRRLQQILSKFNDIRELMLHEGSKGTRVEGVVRNFLLEFLPRRYDYGSGMVVDSSGSEIDRSKQKDILVVDKFFNPRLFLDEEPTAYPVEVVYCGIEVKTSLDKNGLKTAVENIASLKRLKPVPAVVPQFRGKEFVLVETGSPLGFIFAFETKVKSAEALCKNYADAISRVEPSARPDLVCILNRGMIGTSRESSKPCFHLHGVLGIDQASGKISAIEAVRKSRSKAPADVMDSQGSRYPIMKMNDKYFPVDVGRTFISFLGTFYEMLRSKAMTSDANLLEHYIPRGWTHYLYKDCEDARQLHSNRRVRG